MDASLCPGTVEATGVEVISWRSIALAEVRLLGLEPFHGEFRIRTVSFTRSRVSPHLSPQVSPRRGYPPFVNRLVFTGLSSLFDRYATSPTSYGFVLTHTRAARGLTPVLALVARATTSSPTDGFKLLKTSVGIGAVRWLTRCKIFANLCAK